MGQDWRQSCKKESSKNLGGVAERHETKRDYAEGYPDFDSGSHACSAACALET